MSDKHIKRIASVVGFLVFAVAMGAFYLTFDATSAEAAKRFASPERAWAVPLILEGGVVVFILWTFVRGVLGQPRQVSFGLVVAYTLLSIVVNASHAKFTDMFWDNVLTVVFAATPSLTVFLAAEALVSIVHTMLERSGKAATIVEYENSIKAMTGRMSQLKDAYKRQEEKYAEAKGKYDKIVTEAETLEASVHAEISALRGELLEQAESDIAKKKEALKAKLENLQSEVEKVESGTMSDVQKAILMIAKANPNMSQAEIARIIGRGGSTVSKHVKALTNSGHLYRNGKGWEVDVRA